jgi:hypothetical protein
MTVAIRMSTFDRLRKDGRQRLVDPLGLLTGLPDPLACPAGHQPTDDQYDDGPDDVEAVRHNHFGYDLLNVLEIFHIRLHGLNVVSLFVELLLMLHPP